MLNVCFTPTHIGVIQHVCKKQTAGEMLMYEFVLYAHIYRIEAY
jgi:hypothetical protein